MIDSMAHTIEHGQQEEAKEKGSSPQELSRRRASLITEFQDYIRVTFHELHLASQEETEALHSPLLAMQCTEEEVSAWERFRPIIPKLLHSAHTLHADIRSALDRATLHDLLPPKNIAHWETFFQSTGAGFQEKEYRLKQLAAELASKNQQDDGLSPRPHHAHKERREKRELQEEKKERTQKTEHTVLQKHTRESPQHTPTKEPLPSPTPPLASLNVQNCTMTQRHLRWLLSLLPYPLTPLYTAAAERGSAALKAVQKTLEQSLVRQNFGLEHGTGTIILTQERLQNTDESLATCQASQNEEAKTIILEPVSLQTQSSVVHGIHLALLHDLHTLERYGMPI